MADPISLLASLLAVATAGIEVSKTLYKLADTIGNSNDEIRAIGEQVSAFSQALGDLHEFLEGASDLISKRASQNARHIVRICREIFAKIGRNLQFSKRKYGNQFWQSVQWMFRRDKVKPLCASLESYKTTLSVMLLTMKLAKCKKSMMNNGSQAPTEKENRYRANLELDILSNSAAITRWHRAEFDAQATSRGNNGPDYVDHEECISTVPAEELQWLSALVPYKPPSSELRLSKEQPTGSQEASNGLNELEHPQITSTINTLLAKWTTLYEPATSRRPTPPVQTLRNLGSAPTARSIKRKARNGTKQPVHASKTTSKGQKESIKIEKVLQKDGNSRHLTPNPSSQNLKVQVESPADWITVSETERNGDWNGSIARKGKEDKHYKKQVHKSASPFDSTGEDNSRSYGALPPVNPNSTQYPMSFTSYPPFRVPYHPTSTGIPSHGPPSQESDIMTDPLAGWNFQPFGGPSLPAPSVQHPTVTCHPAIPILEPVTSAASSPIPSQPMPEVRHDEVRGPSLTAYQNYDIHELVSLAKDFIKTAGDEESEGESKNVTRKPSDDSHHSTENLNEVLMATAATPIKVQPERLKSGQGEQPTKVEEYVTLKDFAERVFKFPYRMCNTWTAMQARIQDILNGTANDEKDKIHVQNGYFDLCDENDEIILPTTWDWIMEDRRQNGITLNMKLWPFQGESGEETSVEGKSAEGTGELLYTMTNLLIPDDGPPQPGPQESPSKPSTKPSVLEPDSQSVCTEGSDDPAEDFVGDDLDWRYNFLYKLDEHDERFQRIWEVEMRRSQVKAEHTMLSFLLGESKAQLDELDFGEEVTQSTTKGTAQPSNEKADSSRDQPSTSHGSTGSVSSTEDIKDGVPDSTDQANNSTASPPPQTFHPVPPPMISDPGPPETGVVDSDHHSPHESQGQRDDLSSDLLASRLKALEDANLRANDAAAKAHALEQKLKQVEDAFARRVLQTPPKTPPAQESSFTLSVGAGSSSKQASIKNAESVKSKSTASFRKRIFGRNRSSGTVS